VAPYGSRLVGSRAITGGCPAAQIRGQL